MSQYTRYPTLGGGGGGGSVTSVGLIAPVSVFSVTGTPVTSSGNLTLLLNDQAANTVWAAPDGSSGSPAFRALVAADIDPLGYIKAIGAFGSSPNANGGTISGNTLTLQPADGTHPGGVSTLTQTFGGNKTFSGSVAVSLASTTALTVNSTSFLVDSINNAIGVGVAPSTSAVIDVVNNSGSVKAIQATGYGSNVGMRGRRANGTMGSPTQSLSGDILSFYSGRGYGATGFAAASTGVLNVVAGENFTDSSMSTYLSLFATPTGSVTAAEAMRVASTGVTLGPQSGSTASHKINGAIQETTRTVTAASFTVDTTTSDTVIFTDSTSNTITITLPAPTNGRMITIQDKTGQAATNAVTVNPHAAETINGDGAVVISRNYGAVTLLSDGTNWTAVKTPTSGFTVLTSGTTYTTPTNITPQTRFKFTLIGGGGGGGGINTANASGSGGGGGGTAIVSLTGLVANTAYTIAIGAGGNGGISTTTPATVGGSTTLTANAVTYTAVGGGLGADTVSTAGGAGGGTTNATIGFPGADGAGSGPANANSRYGGGGASSYGAGGQAIVGASGTGNPGKNYGGGGAGGVGTTSTGGAGAQGVIIVEWAT